jgi:TRAP-type C4-dicarboxylate transport system permease small subunit
MISAFVTAIGALSRLFAIIATLLLIAAMLVVCEMILMRYVFRAPTIWQTDFVIFSATAATFLGAPYVLLKKGHVGVDVVELALNPGPRRVLKIVGAVLGLIFCAVMLVASVIALEEAWAGNWKHASVWAPPLWIPMSALPLGFGMLCLQYVADILKLLTSPLETPADAVAELAGSGDVVTAHALKEVRR